MLPTLYVSSIRILSQNKLLPQSSIAYFKHTHTKSLLQYSELLRKDYVLVVCFFFHVAKFKFSLTTTVHSLNVSHVPGIMANAVCNKKHFIYALEQMYTLGTINTPILQVGKLRLWEVKSPFKHHPTVKQDALKSGFKPMFAWFQSSNPWHFVVEARTEERERTKQSLVNGISGFSRKHYAQEEKKPTTVFSHLWETLVCDFVLF